jgi:hypothetical protein
MITKSSQAVIYNIIGPDLRAPIVEYEGPSADPKGAKDEVNSKYVYLLPFFKLEVGHDEATGSAEDDVERVQGGQFSLEKGEVYGGALEGTRHSQLRLYI